jgi:hypothetical protein
LKTFKKIQIFENLKKLQNIKKKILNRGKLFEYFEKRKKNLNLSKKKKVCLKNKNAANFKRTK